MTAGNFPERAETKPKEEPLFPGTDGRMHLSPECAASPGEAAAGEGGSIYPLGGYPACPGCWSERTGR